VSSYFRESEAFSLKCSFRVPLKTWMLQGNARTAARAKAQTP
jgi:hypothetical protein